jgi:hypothetical protein
MRERPSGWPSDAAALGARGKVFVEILSREPGVWGGPGLAAAKEVSGRTHFAAQANIEAWWNPAFETAVKHALARLD